MKFFAVFAFVAIFAVATATPWGYEPEYEYQAEESAPAPLKTEMARPERSYAPAKACKAVLVACGPIVQKVKCKK